MRKVLQGIMEGRPYVRKVLQSIMEGRPYVRKVLQGIMEGRPYVRKVLQSIMEGRPYVRKVFQGSTEVSSLCADERFLSPLRNNPITIRKQFLFKNYKTQNKTYIKKINEYLYT